MDEGLQDDSSYFNEAQEYFGRVYSHKIKKPSSGKKGIRKRVSIVDPSILQEDYVKAKLQFFDEIERETQRLSLAPSNDDVVVPPDAALLSAIRGRLSHLVRRTSAEAAFEDARLCSQPSCSTPGRRPDVDVTTALDAKMKASTLGCFLLHLNPTQSQESDVREHKMELEEYEWKRDPCFQRRTDFISGFVEFLKKVVNQRNPIETKTVVPMMTDLRLNDCQITRIDGGVKKLLDLEILSLAGNSLTSVPGNLLPRKLKILELYNNFIADVTTMAAGIPRWMLHLGLARNKLTDDSNLDTLLLSTEHLRSLDLSDNDICDLTAILKTLAILPQLSALSLQGNPCATCLCYREAVLDVFPRLLFLDNCEVWPLDVPTPTLEQPMEDLAKQGVLQVTCLRVMGLPQPPARKVNKKKLIQTFQVEVELPLLDVELRGGEVPDEEVEEDVVEESKGKEKGKKDKSKKGKSDTKSKGGEKKNKKEEGKSKKGGSKGGKSGKSRPQRNPLDLLSGVDVDKTHRGHKSSWFVSSRQPWSKMIEFPVIEISAPDDDLTLLRDTLRSTASLRLVLLKTLPPGKPKKPKKPKKLKKGQTAPPPPPPPPPPEETVVSRTTLAKFDMELQSVAWCDRSQDYAWSMDEEWNRPKIAVPSPVGQNLWGLSYENAKGKKNKADKADKGKEKAGKNKKNKDSTSTTLHFPSELTLHVSVGLKRVQIPVNDLSPLPVPPVAPEPTPVTPLTNPAAPSPASIRRTYPTECIHVAPAIPVPDTSVSTSTAEEPIALESRHSENSLLLETPGPLISPAKLLTSAPPAILAALKSINIPAPPSTESIPTPPKSPHMPAMHKILANPAILLPPGKAQIVIPATRVTPAVLVCPATPTPPGTPADSLTTAVTPSITATDTPLPPITSSTSPIDSTPATLTSMPTPTNNDSPATLTAITTSATPATLLTSITPATVTAIPTSATPATSITPANDTNAVSPAPDITMDVPTSDSKSIKRESLIEETLTLPTPPPPPLLSPAKILTSAPPAILAALKTLKIPAPPPTESIPTPPKSPHMPAIRKLLAKPAILIPPGNTRIVIPATRVTPAILVCPATPSLPGTPADSLTTAVAPAITVCPTTPGNVK